MRHHSRPLAGLVSLLLVVIGLALGCREDVPPLFRRNQLPETTLTVVPEDSAQGFYRYHVYWRGEDTDGKVLRYIFAITDTLTRNEEDNWNPAIAEDRDRGIYTTKSDSVFIFNSARGRQAFNITAIDDFGDRDPSPARAFFRIVDNGLPCVRFLGVRPFGTSDTRIFPCGEASPCSASAAPPCTIPTFTNFKVSFTGVTSNGRINGLQWQGIKPGEVNPESFQPFGADSLYLPALPHGERRAGFHPITGDTTWLLQTDTVTVYYRNVRGSSEDSIPSGNFVLRARVRDEARRESLLSNGTRRVSINFDPETRLYKIAACDCPKPPPNCASRDSIRAGYIVGVEGRAFPDSTSWIRFCDGDTIPQLPWVRFYSRGVDDSRDVPRDGSTLREVGFSARFAWSSPNLANTNMPFSPEYPAQTYTLPPIDPRGAWRGIKNGWGDTEFPGACPFNFTYYVSAVDENGKRDGTPDSLGFYVSGAPQIDSTSTPKVLVLVPKCQPGFDQIFCPSIDSLTFGPDTVLVRGTWVDVPRPPGCTFPQGCNPGENTFKLPLVVYGHDHPRDRDPALTYSPPPGGAYGRIRSWFYDFQCLLPGCEDQFPPPGEGRWRDDRPAQTDPPNQQVFDDSLVITAVLDTMRIGAGPLWKAVLVPTPLGTHRFSVQGRDTDAGGQHCSEPSDLSRNPASFDRDISEEGRVTQQVQVEVILRQLQDVRPYVSKRAVAAQPRASRKGWWRR